MIKILTMRNKIRDRSTLRNKTKIENIHTKLLQKISKNLGIASLVVHIHGGNPYAGPMPGNADSFERSATLSGGCSSTAAHTVFRITGRWLTNLQQEVLKIFGGDRVVNWMLRGKKPTTRRTFWDDRPDVIVA